MFSLTLTNDQDIEEKIIQTSKQNEMIDSQIQERYQSFQYPYDTSKPLTLAVTKLPHIQDQSHASITDDNESFSMKDNCLFYAYDYKVVHVQHFSYDKYQDVH